LTPGPLQVRAHVQFMLARRDQTLKDVVDVLRVYHDNIAEDTIDSSMAEDERGLSQKMILEGLLNFLESC
jgi:beta-catenin-like protein 1